MCLCFRNATANKKAPHKVQGFRMVVPEAESKGFDKSLFLKIKINRNKKRVT